MGATIWTMHAAGGVLVALLVLIRVLGALRHDWLLNDNVLRRMTPFIAQLAGSGRYDPD